MAKRARGTTTRPGQRAPLPRTTRRTPPPAVTGDPVVRTRPVTLTPEEEARAAELEAQIVAEERMAEEGARRTRDRGRRSPTVSPSAAVRPVGIAVQAADEYAYVARDVRRIAVVGGLLLATLLGLWAVAQATGFGQV